MHFIIAFYIGINRCAIGMRGYGLQQTQQATLGLHSSKYTGGSATKEDDTKNIFLDELHTTVMSGIENAKRKYNKRDKKNGYGRQQIKTKKIRKRHVTQRIQTEDLINPSQKIKNEFIDYDKYDADLSDLLLITQEKNATTIKLPEFVNRANIKSEFHLYEYNLQHTQKIAIYFFQKTLDIANPIMNKLSHIDTIIREFYNKQITYIEFQEYYNSIMCQLDKKINDIVYIYKKMVNLNLLYNTLQEYDEKMTKDVATNSSIKSLTRNIMTIGVEIFELLDDFIMLHGYLKQKHENEIKDIDYENTHLENEKIKTDKTMTDYDKHLTVIKQIITFFNEEKERLNNNLGLLHNCMKKKDNLLDDLNKLEMMHCQKRGKNNKRKSILEDTYKENICDIDNQENVKNVLHAIIEQNCEGLQQNENENITEQAADTVQCDGEECEEMAVNRASTTEKAINGFYIVILLYSIINLIP